jgi:hypothetical protein
LAGLNVQQAKQRLQRKVMHTVGTKGKQVMLVTTSQVQLLNGVVDPLHICHPYNMMMYLVHFVLETTHHLHAMHIVGAGQGAKQ